MQSTKQPLIVIEGKDCTYTFCNGEGICEADRDYPCPECKNGKSPTTLIFDADNPNFRCIVHYGFDKLEQKDYIKKFMGNCDCKNGYLLPKKGELICGNCCHQNHFLKDCPLCECEKYKPFRLSSDAVLKSVGDMSLVEQDELRLVNITQSMKIKFNHNLTESSMLMIATGYYE